MLFPLNLKLFVLSLSVFLSSMLFAQMIDIHAFNSRYFDQMLFRTLNAYRKEQKIDTLLFSDVLYHKLSKVQIQKMMASNTLLHYPYDMDTLYPAIADESDKKYGGKVLRNYFGETTYKSISEIILYDELRPGDSITYEQLARESIARWHRSSGHQWLMSFVYESQGIGGLASCATGIRNRRVYCCCNFTELSRVKNRKEEPITAK